MFWPNMRSWPGCYFDLPILAKAVESNEKGLAINNPQASLGGRQSLRWSPRLDVEMQIPTKNNPWGAASRSQGGGWGWILSGTSDGSIWVQSNWVIEMDCWMDCGKESAMAGWAALVRVEERRKHGSDQRHNASHRRVTEHKKKLLCSWTNVKTNIDTSNF